MRSYNSTKTVLLEFPHATEYINKRKKKSDIDFPILLFGITTRPENCCVANNNKPNMAALKRSAASNRNIGVDRGNDRRTHI